VIDTALREFSVTLQNELRFEADIEGAESMLAEVFTRRMITTLVEVGEIEEEAVQIFHRDDMVRPAVEVAGYSVQDGDTLNLIAAAYRGGDPEPLTKADAARAARRARNFWQRCRDRAYHDDLEESSDAHDMALAIRLAAPDIRRVRTFVITDGLARVEYLEPETEDGVEYHQSLWDLQRLWRLESAGRRGEPIIVDFTERFGRALPALVAPRQSQEYQAYMAVIPGDWLADIYEEFGARLLERNVRSFLQFTGKVNKGMRDTIRDQPGRFLAYNNGISATASSVEIEAMPDGGHGITRMRDLQIVNGGQTTASLHRASRSTIDVSGVAVQAKITQVEGELLDELVPRISEYANSQNKVQIADLSSNLPFHVELESLSRNIWAPLTAETARQTKWFYERARGQYSDAMNRDSSKARFQAMHPTKQRFSKVDLATFENTWDGEPHEVSKGAQKNFTRFMQRMQSRGGAFRPDVAYFQRAVAKAILFRRAERIVQAQQFGGYRRNIVAYSVARLSYATSQRLDLKAIWENQQIGPEIERALVELAHLAHAVLTDDDRPAANVTEWAKRPTCWERMRLTEWRLPPTITLTTSHGDLSVTTPSPSTSGAASHETALRVLDGISGDTFLAISSWAKQTDKLSPWQRRFASTIGGSLKHGRALSDKQIPHAFAILAEARAGGFRDD